MKIAAAVLFILMLSPNTAIAHTGERLFSIPYVSAEDVAHIQLDGQLDDWKDLFEDPTVTALDFHPWHFEGITSYSECDPANLDFRIWLAWGDGGKIYGAVEAADNVYRNDERDNVHYFSDHLAMMVDGDHSGGRYVFLGSGAEADGPDLRNNG